jgi:hypothetical protein
MSSGVQRQRRAAGAAAGSSGQRRAARPWGPSPLSVLPAPARFCPLLLLLVLPRAARAQEFQPPKEQASAQTGGVHLGLFGFGTRLGVDPSGRKQALLGTTLDVGDLFTDRVRLRPSVEVGLGDSVTTYVVNLELLYRFTADSEVAVPYVAFGPALYSQERCATAVDCPQVWAQFALGFELRFRGHMNWLLEYHGEDALRRHRFFIGLTTRRGP